MPNEIVPYDPKRQLEKPKKRTLFPLPSVPDDGSRICVKVNIPNIPAHRQAFLGAIYNLTRWYSWEQDEAHTAREIATVWKGIFNELLDHFYDGCPEDADCRQCLDFLPEYPIVHYAPNDPFRTPDYTPPGYIIPPWYKNPTFPLPGVLPTDAMVNLLSLAEIPIAALADGMPRFSITTSGTGELELEFVKIPQGGYVIVQSDDAVGIQLVDLHSTSVTDAASLGTLLGILGLPGDYDIVQTETVELHFDVSGLHVTNCTFIPAIGGDVILGFGGGLRRVSLCGLDIPQETPMALFQVDGCLLQWRPNDQSSWQTLVDLSTCAGGDALIQLRQNPDNSCLLEQQIVDGGDWLPAFDFSLCAPGTGVTPEQASLRCRYAEGVINEFWVKHARPFFAAIYNSRQAEDTYEDAYNIAKGAWGWVVSSGNDFVLQSLFDTFWEWPTTPPPDDIPAFIDALDGNGLENVKKVFFNSMNEHGDIDDASVERFRVAMQSLYDAEIPTAEWDYFEAAFATAWLINKAQILLMLPDISAGYADTDCAKFESSCYVITVLGTDNPKDTGIDVQFGDLFLGSVIGLTAYEAGGTRFDAAGDDSDSSSGKIISGAPRGALIGRIGTGGTWFLIGTNTFLTIPEVGRLYLAINDVSGDYANNEGSLTISPCIYRAPVDGCSLNNWTVALGTFVSRTNTSITVSSFHTGNQWLAAIQASDINDCCIFRDSVVDPPGSLTEIAVTHCGVPQGTNLQFSYTFYEVNYILAGSTYGPFTIQFKSALA